MNQLKHNLVFQNTSGKTVLTIPVRPEGIDPLIVAPMLKTLTKNPAHKAVFQNITQVRDSRIPGIHANTTGTTFTQEQEQDEPIPILGSYNAMTGKYE